MQVKAKGNGLKVSPRKMGLAAGLIRLRSVKDALKILENTPKKSARLLKEVIKSAQANAEHNFKIEPNNLWIKQILVGPGQVLRRFKPAPMGRIDIIRRRSSNVTVLLEDVRPSKNRAGKSKTEASPIKARGKS